MSFERSSASALEYEFCRYGKSRLTFRGPERSLNGAFVSFLGGTETFGKCVPEPFADLVESATGATCLNLGQMNGGIDAFIADPEVPHLLSGARLSVVQVLGAANISNRLYRVHPRRNDRFLTASSTLASIYEEVDFTEFTFNRHMLQSLQAICPARFEMVEEEVRTAWTARMRMLLGGLKRPALLLWINMQTDDPLGNDPLLVTPEMVEDVSDLVCKVVRVDVEPAGPANDIDGMVVGPTEWPAAARLMGPRAHAEVAAALAPIIG